ncbi:MAG: sigma-70 family RNA polymerase sigma factor, partial [Planctomycetaceae bacterium]|nr:sigma-70 family RNA polymerase sigma factor [Planctomycetaceae bacterium]
MSGDILTDAELLSAFLEQQDSRALETLIERHSSLVWRVCQQYAHSVPDAEDLFQTTFRKLIEQSARIRNRQTLAVWLMQVARNEALSYLKKSQRTQNSLTLEQLEASMSTESYRERQEDLNALFEELEALPEKYQESVVLCCLEGRTQEQAATELGLTASSVKMRLERGRKLLKRNLLKRGAGLTVVLAAWESNSATASTVVASQLVPATVEQCVAHSVSTTSLVSTPTTAQLSKGALLMATAKKSTIVAGLTMVVAAGLVTGIWFKVHQPSESNGEVFNIRKNEIPSLKLSGDQLAMMGELATELKQ